MRAKIENHIKVVCDDIDLRTISNIEFYVRQGIFFRQYTPEAIEKHEMVIVIPYEDAMQLREDKIVNLQFAYTDAHGSPDAADTVGVYVRDLLKESGYDPV